MPRRGVQPQISRKKRKEKREARRNIAMASGTKGDGEARECLIRASGTGCTPARNSFCRFFSPFFSTLFLLLRRRARRRPARKGSKEENGDGEGGLGDGGCGTMGVLLED